MPPSPGQIKKIHALKGALQMDDETYRETLKGYGVKSSTKLSIAKADELLQDLEAKAIGMGNWVSRKPAQAAKTKQALADDPQSKKIRQLWLDLHDAGKVKNPAESALVAYVKRMTSVAALQWLSVKQASTVIEALKKWMER
jgi:phage gp16-like protein